MKLAVEKLLPLEKFKQLLANHSQIVEEKAFAVGVVDWTSLPEFVRDLMQRWTSAIDLLSTSFEEMEEYAEQCFVERGVSYREYLSLWNNEIPESDFVFYTAHQWFGIVTTQQRQFFILDREPSIEGFCKTITSTGLQLFSHYAKTVPVSLPLALFKRHCYISGLSGSGKSELLKRLIYTFQKNKECSVVLIDPHGDLATETFAMDTQDRERIIMIDPFLFPGKTPVLNPLQLIRNDEVSIQLATQQITRVFEELIKNAQLSSQMEAVLRPCIATLLRAGNMTLYDLQRFMSDKDNKELVALGTQSPNPAHRQFFQSQFHNPNYAKTKSSIYTKVFSLLGTQTFFNLTVGRSTFNLEQLIEENKIIIFNLSKGKMGDEASRAFGQFVVGTIQALAERRASQHKKSRTPTYLLIDEFQDYVTSSMAKILKESRKYALHLILANQFIDDIHNTTVKQAIKTNTDIKIHGRNDADHFDHFYETMLLEKENLLRLKEHEFYVKAGVTPSYKMTTLLVPDDRSSSDLSPSLLDSTKQYYTPLSLHDRKKTNQRITPKFKL